MISHTRSYSVRSSAGGTVSSSYTEAGNSEQSIDQSVAAGSTGVLINVAFTRAGLQSFQLVSDQPCTIALNTNTSPPQTIALKAGMPFDWSVSPGYFSNPFSVDVTALFVTTTLGTRIRGRILTS
jgi:hypothetical protein